MESMVIRVHTVDGQEHTVRLYLGVGVESQILKRLPTEIAAGVWVDEKTFIPGTAIVRAEIIVGKSARFPE